MSMKCLLVLSTMLVSVPAFASTALPDACGSNDIKFDVKTDTGATYSPTAAPPAGHARVIFIQNLHASLPMMGKPTIRIGVDGAWAGALHGKSFFALDLPTGEHHLCGSWQSVLKSAQKETHAKSLNLEPGKTYFVQFKIEIISGDPGVSTVTSFDVMDRDEAQFLLKTYPVATWTTSQPVTQASTH